MKMPHQVIAAAMDEEKMMYDSDEANADQIISALTTAGYVIVPKVPTKKMIDAAVPHVGLRGVMLAYCDMIEAVRY